MRGAVQPPPESSCGAVGASVGGGVGGTAVAVGGTAVGVAVGGTGVAVGTAVAVGSGVAVGVGADVAVGADVGNGVEVGKGVAVGVGVAVGTGVGVGVGSGVAVGIGVGVAVAGAAVGRGRGVGVSAPSVKLRLVVITKFARYIAVGRSVVGRTAPVEASTSENSTSAVGPPTAACCTSIRYWSGESYPFPVKPTPNRAPVDFRFNCTAVPAGAGAPSIVTRPVNTATPPWAETARGSILTTRIPASAARKARDRARRRRLMYLQSR